MLWFYAVEMYFGGERVARWVALRSVLELELELQLRLRCRHFFVFEKCWRCSLPVPANSGASVCIHGISTYHTGVGLDIASHAVCDRVPKVDPVKFPGGNAGMKDLTAKIRAMGFKWGSYTESGTTGCDGAARSSEGAKQGTRVGMRVASACVVNTFSAPTHRMVIHLISQQHTHVG
jgi:hypothetical protein